MMVQVRLHGVVAVSLRHCVGLDGGLEEQSFAEQLPVITHENGGVVPDASHVRWPQSGGAHGPIPTNGTTAPLH